MMLHLKLSYIPLCRLTSESQGLHRTVANFTVSFKRKRVNITGKTLSAAFILFKNYFIFARRKHNHV